MDGQEITTSFAGEGAIVFSMDELYYNKVSEEFVETLEDTEAYRILLTDLIRLFETNIELCNWGRIIHQNEYRRLHRSHKERLTLPAKERYEAFVSQFPDVCQRVNLGYIASYLGITIPHSAVCAPEITFSAGRLPYCHPTSRSSSGRYPLRIRHSAG